ncbi:PREDICTED: GATA transcription factor 19-like [Ipomoea nil]|uniref:GATA transcription factor 19-like n=1 Tax=Ipomoea nil TaxID=35883 RepID=UPI0009019C4D|nr:PREDICTED: GATA transcription factor 19-like [Ipomoea nil]
MMQHRCSSSCGHCSFCGGGAASSAAFSMFLSAMPNSNQTQCYKTSGFHSEEDENVYSFASAPASSVDCTLSLATPSTRRFNENEKRGERRMSNFCSWDILQPSKQPPPSSVVVHKSAADTVVPRRCANCDTTSTPLWRNGPRGPKSLCNACGIRFKKEERRASAAAAATATCAAAGGVGIEAQHMINTSWVHHHHHHTQAQKMGYYSSAAAYGNEFRFIDDDHRDSDAAGAIPFISWRLSNVADRSSLVHDFTR